MITDDCPTLIAELPKLKWKKHASAKVAEQKNKLEDIRDKDNHCYDALKYAMTFMADLTPDRYMATSENEKFHSAFADTFGVTSHIASDIDDSDSWGSNWRGVSSVRELEG
jgi:hypothetical protein